MKILNIVGAASLALAMGANAALAQTPAKTTYSVHDLTGVWLQTGGGKFGAYSWTPEYGAVAAKRKADLAAGNPYQPSGPGACLPRGLVGMVTTGAYPLEIFQTPAKVVVIKENGGVHRIHLNRKHLAQDDLTPLFFGDSIAHWEGDTLVVDSISLGATDNLDGQNPHSDALHVVERYKRTGANTLEIQITVEDPKALTKPVVATSLFALQPDYEMQEYYCINDRNIKDSNGNQIVAGAK